MLNESAKENLLGLKSQIEVRCRASSRKVVKCIGVHPDRKELWVIKIRDNSVESNFFLNWLCECYYFPS